MDFSEIPDAKSTHNHYNHGHSPKHNSPKQQQSPPNQVHTNQRTPKVTHPALVPDDDENIFGSAEDYDDADLTPNIFLRPTKTSSEVFGLNNNHHYPYQNSHGGNNNPKFNIPTLFGGAVSNGASSNVGNGINGNTLNGNNAITRTEVRSSDNEVSTATASTIIAAFNGKYNTYHSLLFDYNFILFAINLIISVLNSLLSK